LLIGVGKSSAEEIPDFLQLQFNDAAVVLGSFSQIHFHARIVVLGRWEAR